MARRGDLGDGEEEDGDAIFLFLFRWTLRGGILVVISTLMRGQTGHIRDFERLSEITLTSYISERREYMIIDRYRRENQLDANWALLVACFLCE